MISIRSGIIEDKEFLWNLKKAAMSQYVGAVYGWDDEVQYSFFEKGFDPKSLSIVEQDGERVGMFELQDRGNDLYIARLEILPERQGHGIGSYLLSSMINQAVKEGKPLRLQVFKVNPAQKLYQRLGFREMSKTETHVQMEYAQLVASQT